jgi:hypothetical protein
MGEKRLVVRDDGGVGVGGLLLCLVHHVRMLLGQESLLLLLRSQ